MKALLTGFHILYHLSQYSTYFLRKVRYSVSGLELTLNGKPLIIMVFITTPPRRQRQSVPWRGHLLPSPPRRPQTLGPRSPLRGVTIRQDGGGRNPWGDFLRSKLIAGNPPTGGDFQNPNSVNTGFGNPRGDFLRSKSVCLVFINHPCPKMGATSHFCEFFNFF